MADIIDTKQCVKCGTYFNITKYQKTRKYCSDRCSAGWTKKKEKKNPLDEDVAKYTTQN
tara:strand:+ start:2681 stop:2857 length:177 start_codon:yes stop_codon:yes gene_type:complete